MSGLTNQRVSFWLAVIMELVGVVVAASYLVPNGWPLDEVIAWLMFLALLAFFMRLAHQDITHTQEGP